MPFGFHLYDLLIILLIVILLFGAKRLPEIGSSIGKTVKEFRKSAAELNSSKEEENEEIPSSSAANFEAIERKLASRRPKIAAGDAAPPEIKKPGEHLMANEED